MRFETAESGDPLAQWSKALLCFCSDGPRFESDRYQINLRCVCHYGGLSIFGLLHKEGGRVFGTYHEG